MRNNIALLLFTFVLILVITLTAVYGQTSGCMRCSGEVDVLKERQRQQTKEYIDRKQEKGRKEHKEFCQKHPEDINCPEGRK